MLAALPVRHAGSGTPDDRVLPASTHSRAVAAVLRGVFPGPGAPALTPAPGGPAARPALPPSAPRLPVLAWAARADASAATFVHGKAVPGTADPALARPAAQRLSVVTA